MTYPNLDTMSKAQLIELRNACDERLCQLSNPPKEEKPIRNAIVNGHLFGQDYYMERVQKGDYSHLQLLTIKCTARANGWRKLLDFIEDAKEQANHKVDATSFFKMMESM